MTWAYFAVIRRAGASPPSRTSGTEMFIYHWASGASPPSRPNGTIFLYIWYVSLLRMRHVQSRAGASPPSRTEMFIYKVDAGITGQGVLLVILKNRSIL